MKGLSVIIPAYNEEEDIGACLSSLKEQSYKNNEVIVVDDGSTDKTREIIKKFKGTKLIEGTHKGPGFSRNLGAKVAKGQILIFVDADMTFDENYLKNLVAPLLSDKTLTGTTHELEVVKNTSNIWSRCWGKIRVAKEEAQNVKIFRAIRRKKFLELGGFDSKYGYADDQTLWFKYKMRPKVARGTLCYHRNPETLKAVYNQSRWIGASIDSQLFKIPFIGYLIPFALVLPAPLAILVLAIKRCQRNDDFVIFPQMLLFMAARYFGTVNGVFRKVFLHSNIR